MKTHRKQGPKAKIVRLRRSTRNKDKQYKKENVKFTCTICQKIFERYNDLCQHLKQVHDAVKPICGLCDMDVPFDKIDRHLKLIHGMKFCDKCDPPRIFTFKSDLESLEQQEDLYEEDFADLEDASEGRESFTDSQLVLEIFKEELDFDQTNDEDIQLDSTFLNLLMEQSEWCLFLLEKEEFQTNMEKESTIVLNFE